MLLVRNASILLRECPRRKSRRLTTYTKKCKGGITMEKVAMLAVVILLLSGCATGTVNSQMQRETAKEKDIMEAMFQELEKEPEPKKEKAEVSIAVGVFTRHFASEHANERNRMLALSYNDWCVAWFKNSHYDETLFVGYGFRTDKYAIKESDKWFWRAGLYLGAVYGYHDNLPNIRGISPYGLPVGELGYGRFSFELGLIPAPGAAGLVTGLFKYTF